MLKDIFGNTVRIKILEELISKGGIFLSVGELSRMSDMPAGVVHRHIIQLKDIGLLEEKGDKSKKLYRLKKEDQRALALGLIENLEFARKH